MEKLKKERTKKTERSLIMQMSVPRIEADVLQSPTVQSLFQWRKIARFQSPLENRTPLPPNLLKKCGFAILLKDQTQTNNGTCEKNIRRRLGFVSIQRTRAKRPEEKGIQDKMRLGFVSIQRSRVKRPGEKGIQDKMRPTQ